MKVVVRFAGIVAVILALAGCAGINSPNVPSFLTSGNLARIEVTNNQNGHKGVASTQLDNINELLNVLHLGNIAADSRTNAPAPTASAYTLVAYDSSQVVWTLQIIDPQTSSHVYLSDALHPANSGVYPLKQSIVGSDLDQFIQKYPAS
jgi:hypothetical protein